jgi:eukaryotic-like serine/threonine-protein kinase
MGKMIDHRYNIIEKIGEGGMGAVYLAEDTRLERKVAIKRLHLVARAQDLQIFHQRFEREAKVMARFQHPSIVSVYDYGTDDEGIYLVLEFMPGGSLGQVMRKRRFTVDESIAVLLPLCDALTAIHQRGSVHRDLKPANVLFDDYGNPKLADFGVVKLLQGQDMTFTPTGAAVGTPAYMAPELIGGEASPATDQYALGVIMYELVTGKKPFQGRTPMETLTMQKYEPLPDPRSINPELPGWVCQVLKMALAKEPQQRYASIGQFADILRSGEPAQDQTEIVTPAAVESDDTILAVSAAPPPLDEGPSARSSAEQHSGWHGEACLAHRAKETCSTMGGLCGGGGDRIGLDDRHRQQPGQPGHARQRPAGSTGDRHPYRYLHPHPDRQHDRHSYNHADTHHYPHSYNHADTHHYPHPNLRDRLLLDP